MARALRVAYVRTMIDETILARARVASEVIAPLAVQIRSRIADCPRLRSRRSCAPGVFKLLVPQTFGGSQAHPATMVAVIEEIARADGSAAWCTMVGATSGLMSMHLDEAVAREVYGPDDAVTSGVFAPMGRAVATDGGYRVTGRWPFSSGCEHSKWRMGGAIVMGEGGPAELLPTGAPDVRSMLFRADETRVIPRHLGHERAPRHGQPRRGGHGRHRPARAELLAPDGHADTCRIHSSVLRRARLRRRRRRPRHRARCDRLVRRHGDVEDAPGQQANARAPRPRADGCRQGRGEAAQRPGLPVRGRRGGRGGPVSPPRARLRLAACHAAEESAAVVAIAYKAGGGAAIYAKSPLQRYFRDAHVVTHHIMVNDVATTLAGRVLLGVESDTTTL